MYKSPHICRAYIAADNFISVNYDVSVDLTALPFIIDYFIPYGIDAACVAIIISDVISEMSSCAYSYFAYKKEKKRHGNEYLSRNQKSAPVLGKVLKTAGPIIQR